MNYAKQNNAPNARLFLFSHFIIWFSASSFTSFPLSFTLPGMVLSGVILTSFARMLGDRYGPFPLLLATVIISFPVIGSSGFRIRGTWNRLNFYLFSLTVEVFLDPKLYQPDGSFRPICTWSALNKLAVYILTTTSLVRTDIVTPPPPPTTPFHPFHPRPAPQLLEQR